MKKKEYIEKMANLIISRVRFHAPIVYDETVDFEILDVIGIDKTIPIFRFDKPLSKVMFQAFKLAKEKVNFNLIVTQKPNISEAKLKSLKNFFFVKKEELGYSLLSSINALNINYKSTLNFVKEIEEDYIKVNDNIVNMNYRNFYLYKRAISNSVIYEIREFLLNGKNFILTFTNPSKEKKNVTFEINVVLPHGYYFFKRENSAIKITNLCNKENAYFNFLQKNAKFTFSTISGIESSTHACINMKLSVSLAPLEQKRFYFNYGENKYVLSTTLAEEFFALSQRRICETFDTKILSRNKQLDDKFNNLLPQKIWLSWINFTNDFASEEEYLRIKQSIIKKEERGLTICENFKGLKQVQIYKNGVYKKIYIVPNSQRFILADKTKFFNFKLITNDFFKKNDEIYLSFGT